MAGSDGTLNFDTKIDSSGFQKGIDGIGGAAQKGLAVTGKVLGGAAAAVATLGGAAIKVGSDFEAGMAQVQAISGASGEELEKLKEKAKEMGASTKFSATESAEALNYMAMAGWKTEDMLGGIEGIMNLAAASGEDLATTSDIVTDALTAFGLSASDSTHFADILAAASSNANTNVGLMGETFKYVAPLAGALGYSAEDTATAIGLMANAGIKGSQAGTSLRSIMTRLTKPTKDSQAAMDALGLSITDSSGKMKPLSEILGDMREGFSGLTEDEKASYAAMLGGQEAMSGLLAIVNASDKDFEKLSGAINDCNGSAAEMSAIMQDNLQGQITILQSGLAILGVSLYETMQDTAQDVVQEAQGMVQQLQDAFNEGGLEGLVGASGNVLAQLVQRIAQAAPAVIDAGVNLIMSFCEGLRNAQGIGESGASLIASLITGLMSCTGELWSTAVVLFAGLLSGLAEQLPQILQAGQEAVSKFAQALVENAPSILSSAVTIVTTLFDGIMSALPQIASAGVDILNRLAEGIQTNLPSMIPAAMQALVEFSGSLRENVGLLVDAGLNLIMSLAQSMIDNIPVFIETIPTIVSNIAGIINDNAPKLLAAGLELIRRLAEGLIQAVPVLIANIPKIIAAIVDVWEAFNWVGLGKNIIKFLKDGIVSMLGAIKTAGKNIADGVAGAIKALPGKLLSFGKSAVSNLGSALTSGVAGIVAKAKAILTGIIKVFKPSSLLSVGKELVKGLWNGISDMTGWVINKIKGFGESILKGIKDFFGIHSPSRRMAEEVGEPIAQGTAKGITDSLDVVEAAMDEMGETILESGKEAAGQMEDLMDDSLQAEEAWWGSMVEATRRGVLGQKNALSSLVDEKADVLKNVTELYNNYISKLRETTDELMRSTGLFDEVAKKTDVSSDTLMKNLQDQVNMYGEYWAVMQQLKSRITNEGLLCALEDMGVDSLAELQALNSMTDTELEQYAALYDQKYAMCNAIAQGSLTDLRSQTEAELGKMLGTTNVNLERFAATFDGTLESIETYINQTVTDVGMLQDSMYDNGQHIMDGLIEGIREKEDALAEAMSDMVGIAEDAAAQAAEIHSPSRLFRKEIGENIADGIIEGITSRDAELEAASQGMVRGLIEGIAGMPAKLAVHFGLAVQQVIVWGQQMFDNVQTIIQNVVATAVSLIATLPGRIWTWLVNVVTRVLQWGQQMLNTAKTAVSNMISAIISLLAELPGKVAAEMRKVTTGMVEWGADIISRMTDVGRDIVSGIWNGISSGWDWLKSKVADLAGSLLSAAQGALGIHSPSRKFRDEVGRWLMPGAVEGVEKSMPDAIREMQAQAGKLLAAMQGEVNASLGKVTLNASGNAGLRALTSAGTVVYADNSMRQENNYHVPVVSPSETAKANREAFRKMAGGVK